MRRRLHHYSIRVISISRRRRASNDRHCFNHIEQLQIIRRAPGKTLARGAAIPSGARAEPGRESGHCRTMSVPAKPRPRINSDAHRITLLHSRFVRGFSTLAGTDDNSMPHPLSANSASRQPPDSRGRFDYHGRCLTHRTDAVTSAREDRRSSVGVNSGDVNDPLLRSFVQESEPIVRPDRSTATVRTTSSV